MFDNLEEQQARQQLLALVAEYSRRYHTAPPYEKGDKIRYAGRVYDEHEMVNLVDSALEFWLTAGRYTERFEQELARYLGLRFCAFVNSGSSANLLAFMALTSPQLGERAIHRGDEVITVACGFPSTISPIIQFGAKPVFVDITIPQYNIDVSQLALALSPTTKAIFLAHTLGNPFDVATTRKFCDENNLWLIEDNCDALGSEYVLDGAAAKTGTFGHIGTSSFYPPHHMTTGEGGAVYTDDPALDRIVRSMRDWGRECACAPGQDNLCGSRFGRQSGLLPFGYDHKYVYSHFGYNLKATDLQAAVGCAQLEKLARFTVRRRENFNRLRGLVEDLADHFILPEPCPDSSPSWFGFLLTCQNGVSRAAMVEYLESRGIQTRMLFAGNFVKHPCFDGIRDNDEFYRIAAPLHGTDRVMSDTFWLGVYPGMTDEMIDEMAAALHEAVQIS